MKTLPKIAKASISSINYLKEKLKGIRDQEKKAIGHKLMLENEESRLLELLKATQRENRAKGLELKKRESEIKETTIKNDILEKKLHLMRKKVDFKHRQLLEIKKNLSNKEGELMALNTNLNKRQRAIDTLKKSLAKRKETIVQKEREIGVFHSDEERFHKEAKHLLDKEQDIYQGELSAAERRRKADLEMMQSISALREKEHNLIEFEKSLKKQDKAVLKRTIERLRAQLYKKRKEISLHQKQIAIISKKLKGEVNYLKNKLSKKPKTVLKKVLDEKLLNEKIGEARKKIAEGYNAKLTGIKSREGELKTTLKVLNNLLVKLPKKEIKKFAIHPHFSLVKKVLDEYNIK